MSPLSEENPTEVIGVMKQHIQDTLLALRASWNYQSAVDIQEASRAGGSTTIKSPLTRQIERAYNHMEGYLVNVDTEEPSV